VLGTLPWRGGQAGDAGGPASFGNPGSGDGRWALDDWRSLRAGFMRRTARLMRSVTVTSLRPGEGTTAVAAHLAASLAEVGLAVALVDADLRHPALGDFFGLENEPGLTSTVLSGADPASLLHPAPTAPGLHVVPAGPPLPSPRIEAELYRQQLPRFTPLVDMVIVDAPALGGESDAVSIASATEGVVLVIPSGADQLEHVEAARRALTRSGALLIGTVITGQGEVPSGGGTPADPGQQAAADGSAWTARSQTQLACRVQAARYAARYSRSMRCGAQPGAADRALSRSRATRSWSLRMRLTASLTATSSPCGTSRAAAGGTNSARPLTSVATTGVPSESASRMVRGIPSQREVETTHEASSSSAATSSTTPRSRT
jgi:capsular exopolysaccharide synthesis family protein